MAFHALYYISIGNSSYGTYLLNSEPSLIRRFEDIPNPEQPPSPNGETEEEVIISGYYVFYFVSIFTITITVALTKKRVISRNRTQ